MKLSMPVSIARISLIVQNIKLSKLSNLSKLSKLSN